MSHVTEMTLEIKDLLALENAAKHIGLEVRYKNTYKWYGTHVGDYPLPTGFVKEDMGQCDFALGVIGSEDAYEIGIVKRKDGREGYALLFDFWNDGHGLMEKIGPDGGLLKQEYAAQVAMKEAIRLGHRAERSVNEEGGVVIRLR